MYLTNVAIMVLCLTGLSSCLAKRSEAELRRLRHVMKNLCPGANVCSENTTESNGNQFPDGYTSCCTECSCAENCEEVGNCCFPEPQRQPGDEKDTECTFSRIPTPNKADHHIFSSYYMISKPPDGGCMGIQNTGTKAILRNALAPVYSNISGNIYRNIHVAECHGERDVIQWTPVLYCKSHDLHTNRRAMFDMSAHVEAVLSLARRPTHCEIRFKFPGNKHELDGKHCYKNSKNTCSSKNFPLPPDINLSRDEIIEECQNGGLYSPYRRWENYANVFCHLCNSELFIKFHVCLLDRDRAVLTSTFTSLLNFDLYGKSLAQSLSATKTKMLRACPRDTLQPEECRPIHCPSGQFTSNDGSCFCLFESMGSMMFHIVLRLVPTLPISLPSFDITEITRQLTSPWPDMWNIEAMFYETQHLQNPGIRQIFVKQTFDGSGVKLEAILQHIEDHMPKQWSASFGMFKQSFAGFTNIVSTNLDSDIQVVVDRDPGQPTVVTRSITRLTPSQLPTPVNFFYITKMFFCRQVELAEHEYTFDSRQNVLKYSRTNQTFPDAEFAVVGKTNGGSSIRICIEDSGLHYVGRNSGPGMGIGKRGVVLGVVIPCLAGAMNLALFV